MVQKVGPAGQEVTTGVIVQDVATAGKIVGCTTVSTRAIRSINFVGVGSPGICTKTRCMPWQ